MAEGNGTEGQQAKKPLERGPVVESGGQLRKKVEENLRRAAFSSAAGNRSSSILLHLLDEGNNQDELTSRTGNHLFYVGRVDLPHHPVRLRYLPYTNSRLLLYGKIGFQEMTPCPDSPEMYALSQNIAWDSQMCDCVQTSDFYLYSVSRSHNCSVISCHDEFMTRQRFVEVPYELGCLTSLAASELPGNYLYATNIELNCVLRFTTDDLSLSKARRFGEALWRPFDCCTSQVFHWPDGSETQYLFVSNLDAGIFVFNIDTMEAVAECGDDLSPGAKYLSYDPKRSLLLVSRSSERLLRCYRFVAQPAPERSLMQKIGDFNVASREPAIRCPGPQCVMWDPEYEQAVVISWSVAKEAFMAKAFRVHVLSAK